MGLFLVAMGGPLAGRSALAGSALVGERRALIDDFEDGDLQSELGTAWIAFATGGGHFDPASGLRPSLQADRRGLWLRASFVLSQGDADYAPRAKVSLPLAGDAVTLASAAAGIAFRWAGRTDLEYVLEVETNDVDDYAYFQASLPSIGSTVWVTLRWSELQPPSWAPEARELDPSRIRALTWTAIGSDGQRGCLAIDDVRWLSAGEAPPAPRPRGTGSRLQGRVECQVRPGVVPEGWAEQPDGARWALKSVGGLPVVQARHPELGSLQLILDTGATLLGLEQGLLDAVGAQVVGTAQVETWEEGGMSLPVRCLPSLTLGRDAALHHWAAIGMDSSSWGAGLPFDGVLPLMALLPRVASLDLAGGWLELASAPLPEEQANLEWLSESVDVEVPCRIGASMETCLLDTGSQAVLTVPESLLSRFELSGEPAVAGWRWSLDGVAAVRSVRLAEDLVVGGLVYRTPVVDLSTTGGLVLGADLLQRARLTIDQGRRRLRLEPLTASPVESQSVWTAGLSARACCGFLEIDRLMDGGAAARRGLQVGDAILAVDGTPLAATDASALTESFIGDIPRRLDVLRQLGRWEFRLAAETVVP